MATQGPAYAGNDGVPPRPSGPTRLPPRRPLSPWVPVLLTSLALLTLIGGLSVGDFYWNDLRPDVGRIGANLAQVRDRQRAMMGSFAEAQALLLERQRQLLAQAQDLRRREQAVYDARLEIDAQRAQLAQRMAARDGGHVGNARPETLLPSGHVPHPCGPEAVSDKAIRDGGPVGDPGPLSDAAGPRLVEAANLAQTAAAGLGRDDTLDAARAALSLAEAVLATLPGPRGDAARTALAGAQARLADVRPVDRAALARHLDAVREQAVALRPVLAQSLGGDGQVAGAETQARQGEGEPVAVAARSLEDQFEAARLALDAADRKGFGLALQGLDRWLAAFYDAEPRGGTAGLDRASDRGREQAPDQVRDQIGDLAETPIAAEVTPLSAALAELASALKAAASGEEAK